MKINRIDIGGIAGGRPGRQANVLTHIGISYMGREIK